MNKIRVIDLLNKIANGEEVPKRIKIHKLEYQRQYSYYCGDEPICDLYVSVDDNNYKTLKDFSLDTEIEITEESKKIEHISLEIDKFNDCYYDTALIKLAGKIDEIIDYINDKENK